MRYNITLNIAKYVLKIWKKLNFNTKFKAWQSITTTRSTENTTSIVGTSTLGD